MPIARIEQIELEVLRRLVLDAGAIHHDAVALAPGGDLDFVLGAAHGRADAAPGAGAPHERLQPHPRIEGDLDRVLPPGPRQQAEDYPPEKCAIRAEVESHVAEP